MDEHLEIDAALSQNAMEDTAIETTSAEYLGRWNRLVSTTNWEKGRIICQWRESLIETAAPPESYTDEAWSRRVGNVSPQHVGRLRRVFARFGATYEQYAGLYWSHFQAALDWPDAEMWLEGAVQNGWSVAGMRQQRWEAHNAPPEEKPREEDVFTAEFDEDVDPADDPPPETVAESLATVRDAEAADLEPAEPSTLEMEEAAESEASDLPLDQPAVEPIRPFENLPELPPDFSEAFELFKLAILNHKLSQWREISLGDVVAALESLKQLALAPADD